MVSPPAAGKSTVLNTLQARGHIVILEPVDGFMAPYLTQVFGDMSRWALTFQMEYMHWLLQVKAAIPMLLQRLPSGKRIFVERSPRCQKDIFCRHFIDSGIISDWEGDLMCRMWQDAGGWEPEEYLYMRVDEQTALQRLRARAREGEDTTSPDFMRSMVAYHEDTYARHVNTFTVDATQTREDVIAAVLARYEPGANLKS